MAEFRKAEGEAKLGRRGVWKNLPVPAPAAAAVAAQQEKEKKFEGVVVRVWGADMVSVIKNGETEERKLQLSSIRQPRPSDPKLAGLQVEGKEILRKKLIGKSVRFLPSFSYPPPPPGPHPFD